MTEDHESKLRRALNEEAADVNPDTGAWHRIESRVAAARPPRRIGPRTFAALSAAAAVLVGVVAVAALTGDDSGTDVSAGPAGKPETSVPATQPPVVAGDEDAPGIWPFRTATEAESVSSDQWSDPVFTAERFLRDYVGFTRLTMGEFAQGDSRSGEVTATTRTQGPVTTVFVRRLGEGPHSPWTVIGAATENIVLERPAALDQVSSPLRIEGRSTAFEGNVVVEVREDGQTHPRGELGLSPFIGGSMGEMGPLVGEMSFAAPREPGGAVVAYTDSAMDGAIEEATVVRVTFGGN
jgi:hypothetical protein